MKHVTRIIATIIGIAVPSFVFATMIGTPYVSADPVILQVPFTMQAPYSQWGIQPWEDACEETVTIMVDEYYKGKRNNNLAKDYASERILHTVHLENMYLGFNKDTNADQIVYIINNFFPFEAYVKERPTPTDIRKEIDANRPVIATFAGQQVTNPYFRRTGPEYHTAVINGYDNHTGEYITNEPGVGVGRNFRYTYQDLTDAFHDFLPNGQTHLGQRVSVFTQPNLTELSMHKDADQDGLGKDDEFKYGTLPWLADTDGDGYSDGVEVANGYSPTLDESTVPDGAVVRAMGDVKVFLLDGNYRRYIANEDAFNRLGKRWSDVYVVGRTFLGRFEVGSILE